MDGFFFLIFFLFLYFSLVMSKWATSQAMKYLILSSLYFFFPQIFHFTSQFLAFDSICYIRKNNKNEVAGQLLLVLFNFCRSMSGGGSAVKGEKCGNILPPTFRMSAVGILHHFASPLFEYSVKFWEQLGHFMLAQCWNASSASGHFHRIIIFNISFKYLCRAGFVYPTNLEGT